MEAEIEKNSGSNILLNKEEKKIAIIYHYPCYDGCYAALNAHLYYSKAKCGKNYSIEFFPSNSNNRISEVELNLYKKVYILDKGLNPEDYQYILTNIHKKTKIIIIDHHKSSIDLFNINFKNEYRNFSNVEVVFDEGVEKSASGLTFEYFKNKYSKYLKDKKDIKDDIFSEQYKNLNEYIEDSDTGNYYKNYSHEFKSGLSGYLTPLKVMADFKTNPKFLDTFYKVDVEECKRFGERSYKKYKRNSIKEISGKYCYIVELTKGTSNEKWRFIACYTNNKQYRNHACPILSQISQSKGLDPIGAFVYHCEKDIYKMSLRTHLRDQVDLGYICSLFGGGGHRNAAAFASDSNFFDSIVESNLDLRSILQYY